MIKTVYRPTAVVPINVKRIRNRNLLLIKIKILLIFLLKIVIFFLYLLLNLNYLEPCPVKITLIVFNKISESN